MKNPFPPYHCDYKLLNLFGHVEDEQAQTHYKLTEGEAGLGYD